jgi:hypothetical protein
MFMPSPYNSLVRNFLRTLEKGDVGEAALTPMLAADSVLHAPQGTDSTVDHTGPGGFAGYLGGLHKASGGTLKLKPQSFELRERGAVSLVEATATVDGEEATDVLRVVLGLANGRVQELWIDPVDRESFDRRFGG